MVLLFWCRLTRVVLEKRPLNECSSSSTFGALRKKNLIKAFLKESPKRITSNLSFQAGFSTHHYLLLKEYFIKSNLKHISEHQQISSTIRWHSNQRDCYHTDKTVNNMCSP